MFFDVSRIKLFAFDFDGTLVQSNDIKTRAFQDVVHRESSGNPHALEALRVIIENNRYLDRYGVFSLLEEKFPMLNAQRLAVLFSEECKMLILKAPEVSGAKMLLEAIRQKQAISIINSATPQEPLREIIGQMDIAVYFKEIYGAPVSKTENLKAAMSLYALTPEQVIVIGDGQNDLDAARNIGCLFYGIKNDHTDLDPAGNMLHEDLTDLLKVMHV